MKRFLSCLCSMILITYLLNPLTVLASPEFPTDPFDVEASSYVGLEEMADEAANAEAAQAEQADLGITSAAAILMEADTGTVIYEKDADKRLSPASITKIMTLILIFDTLESGRIKLTDEAATSAYAKSMGGSQVFLEEGEVQNVETLIKCIVVASGNDASVVMAEFIAGSEQEFVKQMNARAKELGMENTNFEDCCGLTDSSNHYTTARDVAVMSRELLTKYPQIKEYSTIWMENITHVTNKGSSEFGLANTNKLIRQYQWATGLKTGSTSLAKYCVSATAMKDGIEMIAVIMAAPDYKVRFSEASKLLDYGYANCRLYEDENPGGMMPLEIKSGVKDNLDCKYGSTFSYLGIGNVSFDSIEKEWIYDEVVEAPITEGQKVGSLVYKLNGKEIGRIDIVASEGINKAKFSDYLKKAFKIMQL